MQGLGVEEIEGKLGECFSQVLDYIEKAGNPKVASCTVMWEAQSSQGGKATFVLSFKQ